MDKIILFQTGLVPTLIVVTENKVSPAFCWGQAEALDLEEMDLCIDLSYQQENYLQ